jgi:hypothetical protein
VYRGHSAARGGGGLSAAPEEAEGEPVRDLGERRVSEEHLCRAGELCAGCCVLGAGCCVLCAVYCGCCVRYVVCWVLCPGLSAIISDTYVPEVCS